MLVDRLSKGEEVSVQSGAVPEALLFVLRVLVYGSSIHCLLLVMSVVWVGCKKIAQVLEI